MVDIQIVHADDYVAKPHLGVQADGGRRFEYNPRVLDIVRLLPRGTIYDRQGIPLATDEPKAIASGRPACARLGISLADVCPDSAERCYPLGGKAFHSARRRADARQLERTQHLVCRARCRRSAARLRRSRDDRAHDRRAPAGRC